ncbi:hypothetical protein BsWGS_18815 [Bradybaena similaris]
MTERDIKNNDSFHINHHTEEHNTDDETGNDTDKRIDPRNGQLSKDIVTDEIVRRKAFRWCQDSIGGAWLKMQSDKELKISPVGGGMSNYLYLVSLPDGMLPVRSEPMEVLLRIYGQISKSTLDFLVHNSVVFALLAERKLGPKPYGMYHDGRIEEFIKARPLLPEDLRKPEIMSLVAEKLAQFHALDMPLCKKPRWFKSLVRGWIQDIQKNIESNSNIIDTLLKLAPSFDLETEFNELLTEARKLNCPIVFCHNDLQGGNFLLAEKATQDTPKITIIDWEYGHYNYRGFDLGNHFNEWMFDYSSSGRPGFKCILSNYPTRDEQYCFFRMYLQASKKTSVTQEDLASMFRETNTFTLHSHFLWGVWAMVQAQTSSIEFDYTAYALTRFEAYFRVKKSLPEMFTNVGS